MEKEERKFLGHWIKLQDATQGEWIIDFGAKFCYSLLRLKGIRPRFM